MTESARQEKEVRRTLTKALGIDENTAQRLTTEFLISTVESSKSETPFSEAGHFSRMPLEQSPQSSSEDERDNLSRRRKSRLPSVFASTFGCEVVKVSGYDAIHVQSQRHSISERHRLAASRRNKSFAKSLMHHIQRQQARQDFKTKRLSTDDRDAIAVRELRSSQWFSCCYLAVFEIRLWKHCHQDRARRLLIKALTPLVMFAVLRRRRNEKIKALSARVAFTTPSTSELSKSSPIVAKWPVEAVEILRQRLKPVALPEGLCICYAEERPEQCDILFLTSGHAVEIPNQSDLRRISAASKRTFLKEHLTAKDALPNLFRSVRGKKDCPSDESKESHSVETSHETNNAVQAAATALLGELEHVIGGGCLGDVNLILGQPRRRTVRCWTDCTGYAISHQEFDRILQSLQPSTRADCLHAAKNVAKGQLAKQSKPTVEQLAQSHPILASWPSSLLTHLQTNLAPQVCVNGEIVVRDVYHCAKMLLIHTGTALLKSVSTVLDPSHKEQQSRVLCVAGPLAVIGLGGVVQSDLSVRYGEEVQLQATRFCELWTCNTKDVVQFLMTFKCVQSTLDCATKLVVAAYAQQVAEADRSSQQTRSSNLVNVVVSVLKSSPAFHHLSERALVRLAGALRPRVTFQEECVANERIVPKEGFVVHSGIVELQRCDANLSTDATAYRGFKDLGPATTAFFAETIVESPVEVRACCRTSCILFVGDRKVMLDAISNSGRDFSAMYATIERCEVVTGLKTAKAAEEELRKRNKEREQLEHEALEKKLQQAREACALRAKEYDMRQDRQEQIAIMAAQKGRPHNLVAQERLEHLHAMTMQQQQMTVENQVFASMSNQLYQYVRNPALQERLEYFSNSLNLLEPVYEKQPLLGKCKPDNQTLERVATLDDNGQVTFLTPKEAAVNQHSINAVEANTFSTRVSAGNQPSLTSHSLFSDVFVKSVSNIPRTPEVVRPVPHHASAMGVTLEKLPPVVPSSEKSPRGIWALCSPKLSEVTVASTEIPDVGSCEASNGDSQWSPVAVDEQITPRYKANHPQRVAALHPRMSQDQKFLLSARRQNLGDNAVKIVPAPPPPEVSDRYRRQARELQTQISLIDVSDFNGVMTRCAIKRAQAVAPPGLPPPREDAAIATPFPSVHRHGVQVMGTSLRYVVNPFNFSHATHKTLLCDDEGKPRVGRALPRMLLHGPSMKPQVGDFEQYLRSQVTENEMKTTTSRDVFLVDQNQSVGE